ncbi:SH2 domain-containing protein 1A [Gadus morhua]|uniref:SH2 domain-containing protein n=1 Tax=Gadus morhua TaxID=8049 RepID=A0A8C5B2Q4_GADMO|nr:SH2 domain-containing protein 1A [Gadus morhua]
MEELSVYHKAIGKEEGERRLGQDGREGCYLIRNSETMPGVYCLCVLCKGFVYTYRLRLEVDGSWTADTADGVEKRHFRNIANLILALQKPDQGIAIPLYFPVTPDRWSLAQKIRAEVTEKRETMEVSSAYSEHNPPPGKRYSKIMLRYKIQCVKKK